MDAKQFYQLAVKFTKEIKNVEPQLVSDGDSEFCMLVTAEKQIVYAGVTSVKIEDGKIMRSCPEFNAIITMIQSGESKIEKMITISFSTMEISQPCEECMKLLYSVNPDNQNTSIFISPDKTAPASELFSPDEHADSVAPPKPDPEASGFAASAPESAPPPPAMNPAPKNPLASASDFNGFGDFSADGGFGGFEAADPVEEPDEPEEEQKAQEQAQQTNPDNPFFNPAPPPDAAPQTMAQPYPQQQFGGYPQQQFGGYPQQQFGGYPQQQSMYIQPGQQSMYIQPGQPPQQSMYIQPNQPQSMYIQPGQQSMYVQPNQQSMYIGQSAHSQQLSAYQQPNYYAQPGAAPPAAGGSTFKNRLANFMDDGDDVPTNNRSNAVSQEELRKQAEMQKKQAKRSVFGKK